MSAWRALALTVALLAPVQDAARLGELEARLAGEDARDRRKAVQELAAIDAPAAWKLVIGALDDASPMVADEAQLALAGAGDAATRKLLAGRDGLGAKDRWIRLRVAEALGRKDEAPDAAALAGALADKDLEIRRAAAWSVERACERFEALRGDVKLLAALEKHSARVDDDGAYAALQLAAVAADPARRKATYEALLQSPSPERRAAAAVLARGLSRGEIAILAARLLSERSTPVRLAAAETLAARATKLDAQLLAQMLEADQAPTALRRIHALLRELSGETFGPVPAAWKDWAAALPDDWKGEPKPRPSASDGDEPRTVAFAGLPILSRRVAFLIDLSGSVREKDAQGRTRKQRIDEELTRTLEALDPQTSFNVIPYVESPIPWAPELAAADRKAVKAALEFFHGRKDSGTGDLWDALVLALEDPEVDTLVVLTDGAPSGGKRWNLELMTGLFEERNRFRRVVLDALLVDPRDDMVGRWRKLCGTSGGRVVEIDWE